MHGLKHAGGSAVGVDSAVDPRIAMIADNDPVLRIIGAFNPADHIPDGAALVVLLGNEMHAHAAGPKVIAEGERALPTLRNAGALQRLQNRRSIRDS